LVPITEAIETGAWLEVTCPANGDFRLKDETHTLKFRIKLKDFSKIDLHAAFSAEDTDDAGYSYHSFLAKFGLGANIWKLDLDIVNLAPYPVRSDLLGELLHIRDEEGFVFERCNDDWITLSSKFAQTSGLHNFYCSELPPKVKKAGAFCYELPEFFEGLSIHGKDGSISEI